jgi:septal ring factor EnvC (AmiA/AmiB activator)
MRKVGIVAAVLGILTLSLNATAVPPAPAPSPATAAAALTPPAMDRIARLESNIARLERNVTAQAARIAALEKGAAADAARITTLETKVADLKTQAYLAHVAKQKEACVNACLAQCPIVTASSPPTLQIAAGECQAICPKKC